MVDNIDNKDFDILSIDRLANISNSTLHDVFEKIIGQSTTQYLQKNAASPGAHDDRQ